jgi:hypothetical protein
MTPLTLQHTLVCGEANDVYFLFVQTREGMLKGIFKDPLRRNRSIGMKIYVLSYVIIDCIKVFIKYVISCSINS